MHVTFDSDEQREILLKVLDDETVGVPLRWVEALADIKRAVRAGTVAAGDDPPS